MCVKKIAVVKFSCKLQFEELVSRFDESFF